MDVILQTWFVGGFNALSNLYMLRTALTLHQHGFRTHQPLINLNALQHASRSESPFLTQVSMTRTHAESFGSQKAMVFVCSWRTSRMHLFQWYTQISQLLRRNQSRVQITLIYSIGVVAVLACLNAGLRANTA